MMKTLCCHMIVLITTAILAMGCSSSPGPDSISSRQAQTGIQISSCTSLCHNSTSTASPDPLATNGTGTYGKHVAHVQVIGLSCDKCHLGYANQPTHMNGHLDTGDPTVRLVFFDATNPTGQWINDTGPSTGSCTSLNCHGTDTLDWYGTVTANFQNCDSCHSSAIGTRRQVTGAGGDFGTNASIVSHHVTTSGDPVGTQCQVCHDQSTHTSGIVRLRNADNGASITYDPAVPVSLEPFCLSCHDADGATTTLTSGGTPTNPFNDGSALGSPPYPYATRIAASWAKSYGHGPNGNHATAKKLTCLGTGQPGTGCHGSNGSINAHGSVSQVLAAQPFKYDNGNTYYAADFALCFNCHANYPGFTKEDILGVKLNGILDWGYNMSPYGGRGTNGWNPPYTIPAVVTHFADHNEAGGAYNDSNGWGDNMNLHWAHLGIPWIYFRGDSSTFGFINCVNCHDVHGSNTSFGAVYDEIGYTNVFPDAINAYGKMRDEAYFDYSPAPNLLDNHPTYCAFNCHVTQGVPTKAWYRPIAE